MQYFRIRNIQIALVHTLLVGALLLAVFGLEWSLGWKLVIVAVLLAVEFFVALLGRDFFDIYARQSLLAVMLLYLVALVSAGVLYEFGSPALATTKEQERQTSVEMLSREQRLVATPGTLFSFFAATVTIVGFTVTIMRLQESHVRISHYDRFLLRLERLLRITLERHGKSSSIMDRIEGLVRSGTRLLQDREGLKIICSVPTLGNMSHHDLYLARVHGLWRQIASCETLRVQIVCVDGTDARLASIGSSWSAIEPSDENGLPVYTDVNFIPPPPEKSGARNRVRQNTPVGKFYDNFRNRDFQDYEIVRGMTEAIEIIRKFGDSKKRNSVNTYEWPLQGIEGQTPTKEPQFHLFWTRRRAIVAMPLDRNLPRRMMQQVTMIGYETTDAEVIERLLQVYNEYTGMIGSGHPIDGVSIDSPASTVVATPSL